MKNLFCSLCFENDNFTYHIFVLPILPMPWM